MKRKSMIVMVALAGLLFGCVSYRYIPVERDEVKVLLDRGESVAVLDDGVLRVNVAAMDEGDGLRFDVDITNLTQETIRLDDGLIRIRQGEGSDNLRDAKTTYTAREYFEKESSAAATMACCMAMGTIAATAGAIRHPTAENRLNAHIAAEDLGDNLEESTERLAFLKENLLYASDIPAGGAYGGIVYGDLWRPSNDTSLKIEPAVVSITLPVKDKDYQFIFERRKR
jgi:hypothetical protein